MNRLILISPDQGSGFKPILWSKNIAGPLLTYPSTARGWKKSYRNMRSPKISLLPHTPNPILSNLQFYSCDRKASPPGPWL